MWGFGGVGGGGGGGGGEGVVETFPSPFLLRTEYDIIIVAIKLSKLSMSILGCILSQVSVF